jgi:hypothetical protein
VQTQTVVEIKISRALMDSSIICPAPLCGMYCSCVAYIPGELCAFVCRACQTRYWVGLGPSPVLRVESTAAAEGAA